MTQTPVTEHPLVPDGLAAAHRLNQQLGTELDLAVLARSLVQQLAAHFGSSCAVLLGCDDHAWTVLAATHEARPLRWDAGWRAVRGTDAMLAEVEAGHRADFGPDTPSALLKELTTRTGNPAPGQTLPLKVGELLQGALVLVPAPEAAFHSGISLLTETAAVLLSNARRHTDAVNTLNQRVRELDILRRIDRELSERLNLEHVLAMTLDWAVRYTAAQAAYIALYDERTGHLKIEAQLGYQHTDSVAAQLATAPDSAAKRAARSQTAQVLRAYDEGVAPPLLSGARSQLAVPICHEDQVMAVLGIESLRHDGLSADHIHFAEQLGLRAGVALENARLYAETESERAKLALILASIGDGVVVLNPANEILLINPAAVAALHLPAHDSIAGQPADQALEGTPLPGLLRQFGSTGELPHVELRLPDGRDYYALISRHTAVGTMVVMHDLAVLKKTEQLKNELLATVSHDLKQPLTVMMGYLELLQMFQTLEPRSMHYVEMLQNAVRSMRMLIDDILNLARIESGVPVRAEPLQIADIVARVFDELGPSAQIAGVSLHQKAGVQRAPPIMADPGLTHTIITNLVGNAIKYTPADGHVSLSTEAIDGKLRISVADTGIGISPADQGRIFDRFFRVRRPETQHVEGTGLGLAIVKRLVEVHGGTVGLHSTLGEGSTFTVSLPLVEPPSQPNTAE